MILDEFSVLAATDPVSAAAAEIDIREIVKPRRGCNPHVGKLKDRSLQLMLDDAVESKPRLVDEVGAKDEGVSQREVPEFSQEVERGTGNSSGWRGEWADLITGGGEETALEFAPGGVQKVEVHHVLGFGEGAGYFKRRAALQLKRLARINLRRRNQKAAVRQFHLQQP
ncbi:MAG: hypothetical protein ACREEM_47460, partial [Blastocatellia bacterium]